MAAGLVLIAIGAAIAGWLVYGNPESQRGEIGTVAPWLAYLLIGGGLALIFA